MSREYALEADPGRLTASFPTFDSLEAAAAAASFPAMEREGLPLPRVLVRVGRSPWEVAWVDPRYRTAQAS